MTEPTPGFVVVDKPGGMTSHDVVGRMRRLAKTRKVGHGGTLDPMATGVLVLAVGRATRLLTYVSGSDKAYDATIRLGLATVTDDAEGEVTATADASGVTREAVERVLAGMTGEIDQVPSSVSAVKIDGKRSYARVRAGEEVELKSRRVTISRLDVHDFRPGDTTVDLDVTVECSSGTYIRAIARDLGTALGVGGHLTALRRTRVGGFTLAEAHTLDGLAELDDPVTLDLAASAGRLLPRRDADEAETRTLAYGGFLETNGIDGPYAVYSPAGAVVAVVREERGKARPEIVLTTPAEL
ncbi:tRNA pseudouridine55 synthase [Phytomonospora endophytica]|uniref:tRNA pseudouridine synthase B n=1 Tax=Phytomonospora endophytica TaxID=714109 RepID=A0A841FFD8_9ACTN|nr:tRNA pseudouridine(55) synthase TruB [Phytomonospora endophytica]MBB6032548.1 tRNA pseudouridine55 synthase [Phytomonospora endophytica]GIG66302.1 tRNA pseudouridine synthase B [Phytomonospora endophytica]